MKSIINTVLVIALWVGSSLAGVFWQDGFESGDWSTKGGDGSQWTNYWDSFRTPAVTTANPKTGKYALEFAYQAEGSADMCGQGECSMAWKEQRFTLGTTRADLWVKFDLYLPENYTHRKNRLSNNKFMILNNAYGGDHYLDFEMWPNSNGSYMTLNIKYGGINYGHLHPGENFWGEAAQNPQAFDASKDAGKWHEWIIHAKFATNKDAKDGVVQVWKNGQKVMEYVKVPYWSDSGYGFKSTYLLGWANSGFAEATTLYIDNAIFSTSKIEPGTIPAAAIHTGKVRMVPMHTSMHRAKVMMDVQGFAHALRERYSISGQRVAVNRSAQGIVFDVANGLR